MMLTMSRVSWQRDWIWLANLWREIHRKTKQDRDRNP